MSSSIPTLSLWYQFKPMKVEALVGSFLKKVVTNLVERFPDPPFFLFSTFRRGVSFSRGEHSHPAPHTSPLQHCQSRMPPVPDYRPFRLDRPNIDLGLQRDVGWTA